MLRGVLLVLAGVLVVAVVTIGVSVRSHAPPSRGWSEFSISPATGNSANINPNAIHSDGMTLATAIAVAYAMPSVRIIAPGWLHLRRYSIHAVVPADSPEPLPALLQKELANRLGLVTHVEKRDFDVYVLKARKGAGADWERTAGRDSKTYVSDRDVRILEGTTDRLAGALQNILGKPAIDETGIKGNYNFSFPWGENRAATVRAALESRYGLLLAEERRPLEALIVDRAEPDAGLEIMGRISNLRTRLPDHMRRGLSRIFSAQR